jgi:hypothetical protein
MALNPVTLITAGIIALGVAIFAAYKHFDGFRKIVDIVFKGFTLYWDVLELEIKAIWGVFKWLFNGIADLWNNTLGKLEISIPDIPGLPGRGKTFGIPNIPKLANGGIVSSPTLALIGESGPEAVVPLSGGMGMGGMTIVVQAGLVSTPDQIGQDIILAIQKAQRRSGQVFANATGVAA